MSTPSGVPAGPVEDRDPLPCTAFPAVSLAETIPNSGSGPLAHTAEVRLLLVEDSLPLRKRLRQLVGENRDVTVVAETGSAAQAVSLFHEHQPDTVLLDWQLEDGVGNSVLLEIKRACPTCRVIVLTNFDTPEFESACRRMGADHFLSKSRDFSRLPELLARNPEAPAQHS